MAHCLGRRDGGQVGEVGETRALHQGNLSPRLGTGPSCLGRGSLLAQLACRTGSFARSLEPCWTRHAGSNCSHCWAPVHWGQPQPPHRPHSDGSGSSTVSPWLLSHSREVILATVTVLTLTDAHMPPPMLRLAGCRLGSSDTGVRPVRGRAPAHRRTSGGRAVSGAAGGRRRIGRNQLGGRELGPAVSQASRSSTSSSSLCPGLWRPNHRMHAPGTLFSVLTTNQDLSTHTLLILAAGLFLRLESESFEKHAP